MYIFIQINPIPFTIDKRFVLNLKGGVVAMALWGRRCSTHQGGGPREGEDPEGSQQGGGPRRVEDPEGGRTQRGGGPSGVEDPAGWRNQRVGGPRGDPAGWRTQRGGGLNHRVVLPGSEEAGADTFSCSLRALIMSSAADKVPRDD